MAEELVAKKDVVLTDAAGLQRQVLAGAPVPADLVEAYQAQTKKPTRSSKKKS